MRIIYGDLPKEIDEFQLDGVIYRNRRQLQDVGSILHTSTNDENKVPLKTDTTINNKNCS